MYVDKPVREHGLPIGSGLPVHLAAEGSPVIWYRMSLTK